MLVRTALNWRGGGGGVGYSRFQVMVMIEGSFWGLNFRFRDFFWVL